MRKFLVIIGFILLAHCFSQSLQPKKQSFTTSQPWIAKADKMVKFQIERRGISNAEVLDVMRSTPRHLFVPNSLSSMAYDDYPLPIGEDQTISQPYIVALMTDLLDLQGDEKVLEIGTGSGYQAAVLSQLVDTVYTIEIVESLANTARKRLHDLEYSNVIVRHGDGYQGWPSAAPFDEVIVTAAPKEVPQILIDQLKVGGNIVIPVGDQWQELKLITKISKGKTKTKSVIPVRFVPMIHSGE
jgi:protein-L-isoaspartate(D-aspartate) O-methyltransferase